MRRLLLALAAIAGLSGCGNANVVTPSEVAQNYMFAVAEGNYPGACAMLQARARARLTASAHSSCPQLFAHCLPRELTSLSHDQAQLFYANTDLQVSGHRADVRLSGPAVTRSVKEVTLIDQHHHWRLTSPGRAIRRCVGRLERRRRHGRERGTARG
jgi:hypothetical protein